MERPKFDASEEVVVSEQPKGTLLLSKAGMTVRVEDLPDQEGMVPVKILISDNVIKLDPNQRLYRWTQEKATDYAKLVKAGLISVGHQDVATTSDVPQTDEGVDASSISEVIDETVPQTQESNMSEEVTKVEEATTDVAPAEEETTVSPAVEAIPEENEAVEAADNDAAETPAPESDEFVSKPAEAPKQRARKLSRSSIIDEMLLEKKHTKLEIAQEVCRRLELNFDEVGKKVASQAAARLKMGIKAGKDMAFAE